MDLKYKIEITWSDEDQLYVAYVPDLPGCMAHGKTYQGALTSIKEAMHIWIETAKEMGRKIPTPKSVLA